MYAQIVRFESDQRAKKEKKTKDEVFILRL